MAADTADTAVATEATPAATSARADAPVGIFDSGIGGLSVLRHVRRRLPGEHILYAADAGFAPYGEKTEAELVARTLAMVELLVGQGIKAVVIACNTATAAGVKAVRQRFPDLPVVGVEPGLKPAAALTASGTVGVLATASTLASERFILLREQIAATTNVRFLSAACVGLATQVEKGELRSRATEVLLTRHLAPLLDEGADVLVLGCTHYPFVAPMIEQIAMAAGKKIAIVDTGDAVTRQLARLLDQKGLCRQAGDGGTLAAFTTGSRTALKTAFVNLLGERPPVGVVG